MGLFQKKEPVQLPPPRHIAIIMDGNGRWAQKRGLPRSAGLPITAGPWVSGISLCTLFPRRTGNAPRRRSAVL